MHTAKEVTTDINATSSIAKFSQKSSLLHDFSDFSDGFTIQSQSD